MKPCIFGHKIRKRDTYLVAIGERLCMDCCLKMINKRHSLPNDGSVAGAMLANDLITSKTKLAKEINIKIKMVDDRRMMIKIKIKKDAYSDDKKHLDLFLKELKAKTKMGYKFVNVSYNYKNLEKIQIKFKIPKGCFASDAETARAYLFEETFNKFKQGLRSD